MSQKAIERGWHSHATIRKQIEEDSETEWDDVGNATQTVERECVECGSRAEIQIDTNLCGRCQVTVAQGAEERSKKDD